MVKWFSNNRLLGRSGQITTLNTEKEWLENATQNSENREFNIISINNDKIIGTVSLEKLDRINRSAVLGIFIGDENFRNKTIPIHRPSYFEIPSIDCC